MARSRLAIIGKAQVHTEDGGQAKIAEITDEEHCVFVRIHSFDETCQHTEFDEFIQEGATIVVVVTPPRSRVA